MSRVADVTRSRTSKLVWGTHTAVHSMYTTVQGHECTLLSSSPDNLLGWGWGADWVGVGGRLGGGGGPKTHAKLSSWLSVSLRKRTELLEKDKSFSEPYPLELSQH